MTNVLDVLKSHYSHAVSDMFMFRRWAKDAYLKNGCTDLEQWGLAFKNLFIAREFKKSIAIIERDLKSTDKRKVV